MDYIQSFDEFLSSSRTNIPMAAFIVNLLLTGLLAHLLSIVYLKYGNSLSNRRLFGRNFLLLTMTTMLIISIVKSSLALSLGLVGALSIIRFRAAIKEPEELAYLFLSIGIGLGFGANQGVITVIAFIIICAIVISMRKILYKDADSQNLKLIVSSYDPSILGVDKISEILKKYCLSVNLGRLDETQEVLEALFLVEFRDFEQLNNAKNALQKQSKKIKVTFLDNRGLF